jgi:2-C-methyl-D-erythritol 4-phosphate cytidylyltransferase
VLNGIVACASLVDTNDWMLVHDAARPCLGKSELRRLIDEAGRDEVGGILAVPVADATDEAAAVEVLGYKPRLVEGSARNLKVTFAGDLDIAERLLK